MHKIHLARGCTRIGLCCLIALTPGSLRAQSPVTLPVKTPTTTPAPGPAESERLTALETKVEEQEKSLEASEQRFNEIKSGKLIRYGITGGVAFAVTTPFVSMGGFRQKTGDVTAMPYINLLPAYWRGGYHRATHVACASQYSGGQDAARKVAREIAHDDAEVVVDALLAEAASWRGNQPTAAVRATELNERYPLPANKITVPGTVDANGTAHKKKTKNVGKLDEVDVEDVKLLRLALDRQDKDEAKQLRANLVTRIANRIWIPTLDARCVAHKWGVWVGVPLPYNTVMSENGTDVTRRMTGGVGGGLAYTPFAYLSIMVGLAYSVYRGDPPSPGVDAPNRGVLTPVISIGGNVDFFTLFRGKG